MSEFRMETADGVACLIWDQPERPINVMTQQGLSELSQCFEAALADPGVRGVVITSAKPDFAAGMDINTIAKLKSQAGDDPEEGLAKGFAGIHALFRRIETAPKPVVAALPGTALGIGLELALACHVILAADNPRAKIGLPEIGLGIFPGAGGSARLVQLLGAEAAGAWLLDGRLTAPDAAQAAGIIHKITAPEALQSEARALALQGGLPVKPWDQTPPHAHPPLGEAFAARASAALSRPMGRAPATQALLTVMREASGSFAAGIAAETREMARILMHPATAASLRTAFISRSQLERGARRPDLPASRVEHLGVIGAGMMGAGIAHAAALSGIAVVLLDTSVEAAERGRAHCSKLLKAQVKKGNLAEEKAEAILARITPATDFAALAGCDLVIEAVFEDPDVKAKVTALAEASLGQEAIFASNTSTLPITQLARASARPENFIGIHFFSPVDRMALVEIIRSPQTSDRAVALALDFARQIRKTPIVVNDARYFYANRCIVPYLNECLRLVGEGVDPARVDAACRALGMPVGGLQLMDETSIDLGVAIAAASKAALGDAYSHDEADAVLIRLQSEGRLGRKNGKGFYDYDDAGKRLGIWPGFAALWPRLDPQPEGAEIEARLVLVQVSEALRALEENVLSDVREGDVAAVLGWGFAPWSGGPFGWVDIQGAVRTLEQFEDLAARHGPRFAPPALLREMAAKGLSFYQAA